MNEITTGSFNQRNATQSASESDYYYSNPNGEALCISGKEVPNEDIPSDYFQDYYYWSDPEVYPPWEVALKIIFYTIAMVLGIFGNALVIFIVVWNKKMRSVTNIYIANLAVSDLIVSCWCMWIHLGINIHSEYPFGPFFCKVNVFLLATASTSSIFFLTVISADRFFAIVFPFHARLTPTRSMVVIACVWIISVLVNVPWLFVFQLRIINWKDYTEVWCDEVWAKYWYITDDGTCWTYMPGRRSYITTSVVLLYFVPALVMIIAYIVIGRKLWIRKLPGEQTDRTQLVQQNGRKKVVRMLIWVLVAFLICWTPHQLMNLWSVWRDNFVDFPAWTDDVRYAIQYLAYFNSALNPILYAGLNENIRSGYKEVFRCKIKKNAVVPCKQ